MTNDTPLLSISTTLQALMAYGLHASTGFAGKYPNQISPANTIQLEFDTSQPSRRFTPDCEEARFRGFTEFCEQFRTFMGTYTAPGPNETQFLGHRPDNAVTALASVFMITAAENGRAVPSTVLSDSKYGEVQTAHRHLMDFFAVEPVRFDQFGEKAPAAHEALQVDFARAVLRQFANAAGFAGKDSADAAKAIQVLQAHAARACFPEGDQDRRGIALFDAAKLLTEKAVADENLRELPGLVRMTLALEEFQDPSDRHLSHFLESHSEYSDVLTDAEAEAGPN